MGYSSSNPNAAAKSRAIFYCCRCKAHTVCGIHAYRMWQVTRKDPRVCKRACLLVQNIPHNACRLLLTLSKSKTLLLFSIFGPVSFGLAFGSPAVLIAVKRYTKQVQNLPIFTNSDFHDIRSCLILR